MKILKLIVLGAVIGVAFGMWLGVNIGREMPLTSNPFYKELAAKAGGAPQWNFYKYVILPGGKDITVYESTVQPNSKEILAKITPFLK